MSFFNTSVPIFSRKQVISELIPQLKTVPGLWYVHLQIARLTLFSSFYTRHDQACLLWGFVVAAIFGTAQFLPASWWLQAIFSSGLTLLAVAGMIHLTWRFTIIERLAWILYSWIALMLVGITLTDLAVFWGWGHLLINICPLWLGLSAIGYWITAIGVQSRAFFFAGALHLLTIGLLPHVGIWEPLITGLVTSGTVLAIAELQWDSNGICIHLAELNSEPSAARSAARLVRPSVDPAALDRGRAKDVSEIRPMRAYGDH